jgi:hypothetical protein
LEPFSTPFFPAVMTAAPYPVVIPQPSRHVRSMGAFSVMATTEISATTVYCEKVDVPMKWRRSLPLHLKREVPSGMTPFPWVARILPQRLVLPDLQNLHSLHSGVLEVVRRDWKRLGKWVDSLECDNVVTRLHVGDTLADRLDDTGALVTKDDRESALGVLPGQCVGIYRSQGLFVGVASGPHSSSDSKHCPRYPNENVPVWQTPV